MRHPISPALILATGLALLDTPAEALAQKEPTPIAVNVPKRTEPVSFANEVADILDRKCVGCHSDALAENKLILETVDAMKKGGKGGPALVPGNADGSLLFRMAAHRVAPVMPPAEKKNLKPLTSDELGLLKLWIDSGAKDDSDEATEAAKPIELGNLPPGLHPINALEMTDDGTRVACGRANVVQLFDVDSGLEILTLGGHKDIIQSLRFSPNGRLLAAGGYEVVTLWNVPTGGLNKTFNGHNDQVKALASLPGDGGYVSGGLDKTIRVWNRDGKSIREFSVPAPILSLAVSPDGASLALGCGDNLVRVIDAKDGKIRSTLKGHSGPIHAVGFHSDGETVVSASADGKVRVWPRPVPEKESESLVLSGSDKPLNALAIPPSGGTIVAGGDDGKLRVWKIEGGDPCQTLPAHEGPILAVAVSPGGDEILTGSADKTAKVIRLPDGHCRLTLASHLGPVRSVSFADGGKRLVTAGGEGGVKVWEATTGQGVIAFGHAAAKEQPIQPLLHVIAPEPGVLVTASADKTLKSWTYEGAWSERRPLGPHTFRVLALDFNPDGTLLAAGAGEPSRSGEIKIWEVGKGLPVRTLDNVHSDTVFGLRFSPDGTKLASGGADKFLKVTRVSDGKELRGFEGHTHHVMAVDWSADGKQLVSGGADNVLKLWDAESGEQVRTMQGAGKQVTALRWIAGKPEIAGASGDKTVRVWNAGNGSVLRNFSGPSDYVFAVAASRDGSRIAAGGADGVLFVWNRQDAKLLRKLDPPKAVANQSSEARR